MKDLIPFISLFLSIFNLIFVAIGVWFVWLQMRKTYLWNRRKYTLDEITRWDDSEFREKRKVLLRIADPFTANPPTYESVSEMIKIDQLDILRQILNYFDGLGSGIRFGLLDDKMIHETLSVNVNRYFNWAKPYILECRKIEPRGWEEIDIMLLRWDTLDKQRKLKNIPVGYNQL